MQLNEQAISNPKLETVQPQTKGKYKKKLRRE